MALGKGSMIENSFGQGLITEANGLNFPKDACVDTQNCVFNRDMTVTRRPCITFEPGYVVDPQSFANKVFTYFQWTNVAGLANQNFTVIQLGNIVSFYDNVNLTPSANKKAFTFDLDVLKFAGSPSTATMIAQFAQGNGKIYIAHPFCDPIIVNYDTGTGTFTVTQKLLLIRDFTGVIDGFIVDQRPTSTQENDTHKYNLYNQGWSVSAPTGTSSTAIGSSQPVLTSFYNAKGVYPSNVDYWWAWKDGLNQFNPNLIDSVSLGNSSAPKGHYIVEAFKIDRPYVSGIYSTALPVINSLYYRPSVVAFFAGRLFFSGVNYQDYTNKIYFTRIIQSDDDVSRCYQQGDPTAENGSDLLPSDGGVINTLDMGTIYRLYPLGYSLIIFTSNGIWSLSGSTGTGFTATDYSISKISAKGISSSTTFTDVNGVPVWWTDTSINILGGSGGTESSTQTGVNVVSLTDLSIKTFYQNIPSASKFNARGIYDDNTNTVYYCYRSVAPSNMQQTYEFDRILTYNTLTKAWGVWTLPSTTNIVIGVTVISNSVSQFLLKFIAHNGTGLTFGQFGSSYKDWETDLYSSYVDAGYTVAGNGMFKFSIPYIWIYIKSDQTAGLNFFHKWDYANDPGISLFTSPQYIYPYNLRDYNTVRKRVQGTGKSVTFHFESINDQPFELQGWAMAITANGAP